MSLEAPRLPVFLDTVETAKMLRISPRTLEGMRLDGTGPRYIKMGTSRRAKVIYSLTDVEAWVDRHARDSTSPDKTVAD